MPLYIGSRELDIMAVLWKRRSGTVSEVRAALKTTLAYTTVLSILRNLEAKSFVGRESDGRAHRYYPILQSDTLSRRVLLRLIDTMYRGHPERLLAQLITDYPLTPKQMRQLGSILEHCLHDASCGHNGTSTLDTN